MIETTLILFDDDLDGRTAACIAWVWAEQFGKVRLARHKRNGLVYYEDTSKEATREQLLEHAKEYHNFVVVDLSLTEDEAATIAGCVHLIWIDHHDASMGFTEHYAGYREVDGPAACVLTWQYFHKDKPVPRIVELVGKYDIWQKDEDWEEVKAMQFILYSKGLKALKSLITDKRDTSKELIGKGKVILNHEYDRFRKAINFLEFFVMDEYMHIYRRIELNNIKEEEGVPFIVINSSENISLFSEAILNKFKEVDLIIQYARQGPQWKYSVRSRQGGAVHANKVASILFVSNIVFSEQVVGLKYGYGGRENTAGFSLTRNIFDEHRKK